ncbi:unnamed protein product [Rhizophagus irregularis]|nr:unnamed protein product [Rhizophagus irregularis]
MPSHFPESDFIDSQHVWAEYALKHSPVKLEECLQCYQQKKQVIPSKIENIPIGECIYCHQNKPVKLEECLQYYQQKKQIIFSKIENIPIGECIYCHQNKPVKLGECLQCYQQKKQVIPSKIENIPIGEFKLGECLQCYQQKKQVTPSKIKNISIGECIHCHQNKPVKLEECLQCYQQKKTCLAPSGQMNNNEKEQMNEKEATLAFSEQLNNNEEVLLAPSEQLNNNEKATLVPSEQMNNNEKAKNIGEYMNRMINDKICTRCHTKYQRRFDNFNNQVTCKTCNEQNQKREMYNENGQWFCSLDCMYAKKILDEIGDMKNINKEKINILVNRFTSTNKNAGSTYNITSNMIMEKIEVNMKQNKSNIKNIFDEIKKTPDYTIMYNL